MILLVNGPNLNLLGEREPAVYGRETLDDVERLVRETCAAYGVEVLAFQSNWEGALLDFLQAHRREAEGVILNPGAFTHTSRALPDCLRALSCPVVEVHLSNVHAREPWRRESHVSPVVTGQVVGLGVAGYRYAAMDLCERLAAAAGKAAAPPATPEPWQAAARAQPVVAAPAAATPAVVAAATGEAPRVPEVAAGEPLPAAPRGGPRAAADPPWASSPVAHSPFGLPAPEPRRGPGPLLPDSVSSEGEADDLTFEDGVGRGEYEPL